MSEDEEEGLAALIFEASMKAFYSTYAVSSSFAFHDDDDEEVMAGRPGKKTTAGRVRKICRCEECTNQVYTGGVCKRHGVKVKFCSKEGCTKRTKNGKVCKGTGQRLNDVASKDAQISRSSEERIVWT